MYSNIKHYVGNDINISVFILLNVVKLSVIKCNKNFFVFNIKGHYIFVSTFSLMCGKRYQYIF